MSEIRTIELPAEIWFTIATYTLPEAFSGLCVTSVFINKTIKAWRSSFFFKQDVRDYTMAPTLTLNLLIPVYGEISRTINLVTFGGQESDKIGIYFGDDFLDNKGKWCLLKGANLARCTFKYFQFWSCYVILIDRVVTYVIDSSLSIHSRHNVPSCLYHVCDAMNPFDSSVQLIYDQVGFDKDCCAVSLLLQEDWDVVLAIMKVMTAAGPANEDRFNFFKARITSGRCGVPVPVWDPDEDELDVSEHIPYEGNNERNDGSSDDDDIESSESEEPIQWFRHRSPPVTLNWLFDEGAGPAGNL